MVSEKTKSPPKDKREAIVETMLDLVVERGFHDSPMSLLAKRSGASPGIIYHYFASKDDVIHAVYVHVKQEKMKYMLAGDFDDVPFRQTYLKLFANLYNFYRTHLRETRFLDLYENSTYCTKLSPEQGLEIDPLLEKILKAFRSKKDGGILKDLPMEAVHELSFGVIRRLAKKDETISPADLAKVAAASWTAIAEE